MSNTLLDITTNLKDKIDERLTMALMIASSPSWYKRDTLFTSDKTSVTIPSGLQVCIGGNGYISKSAKTLNLADFSLSNQAGKDIYIYACAPSSGTEPVFVLSANSTVPSGYSASNSRKIGGFHTLCLSVGTISGHALSGYVTGDILPASRWDLLHRPVCESEGMVYADGLGKWIQIYLPSWDGTKLVSRFGGTIVDGTSSYKLHGEEFAHDAGKCGCQLISRDEFMVAMRGSPEGTNINGSTDPNTTGGHVDTNNVRIISDLGVEDGVGVLWQWGRDLFDSYNGTTTWNTDNYYLSGYAWQTKSVFNDGFDTTYRGSCHGLLRRVRLGAIWVGGSACGSRSAYCNHFSSDGWSNNSSRLVSMPRVVNL